MLRWRILANGVMVKPYVEVPIPQGVVPGQRGSLTLLGADLLQTLKQSGTEYFLDLSFVLAAEEAVAGDTVLEAGHEVAWEQLHILTVPEPFHEAATADLKVQENSDAWVVEAGGIVYTFDKKLGQLKQIRVGSKDLMKHPASPEFWRAPNDNDIGGNFDKTRSEWRYAAPNRTVVKVEPRRVTGKIWVFESIAKLPVRGKVFYNTTYIVHGSGDVEVVNRLQVEEVMEKDSDDWSDSIPRIGWTMPLTKSFASVTWYGKGPEESYWDRQEGQLIT